jgi:hypothetical protein
MYINYLPPKINALLEKIFIDRIPVKPTELFFVWEGGGNGEYYWRRHKIKLCENIRKTHAVQNNRILGFFRRVD